MMSTPSGTGPSRRKMTRAEYEGRLESELASRKYEIAKYESVNLEKQLAEIRDHDRHLNVQHQGSRQPSTSQGSGDWGRREYQGYQGHHKHHNATMRHALAMNQPSVIQTPASALEQAPTQEQIRSQQPITASYTPHDLPSGEDARRSSKNTSLGHSREFCIDLTSLEDDENIEQPTSDRDRASNFVPQQDQVRPIIRSQASVKPPSAKAKSSGARPGLSQREAPPTTKEERDRLKAPYARFPTVIPCPDGDGLVELRCPGCGGNASKKPGVNGFPKLFSGLFGFRIHFRTCPSKELQLIGTSNLVEVLRKFIYRKLTAEEVEDLRAGDMEAYWVDHIPATSGMFAAKPQSSQGPRKRREGESGAEDGSKRKRDRESEPVTLEIARGPAEITQQDRTVSPVIKREA